MSETEEERERERERERKRERDRWAKCRERWSRKFSLDTIRWNSRLHSDTEKKKLIKNFLNM